MNNENFESFWIDFDENLEEDIEKHETLNSKLWNEDKTLKTDVETKIQQIVQYFLGQLQEDGIQINIKDIILVGSNCSYNYTKDSDLDIHIIADTSSLKCPDNLYPLLYSAYRSLFNGKYNISFYGIPVEIYVEVEDSPRISNGCYSVLNKKWITEPVKTDIPDIDMDEFNTLFNEWDARYQNILKDYSNSSETIAAITLLIEQLYNLRKEGLSTEGEYSLKNLIFKEFRNRGYLDKLKELKNELIGKELSLESLMTEDTKKIKDHKWVNKGKAGSHGTFKTKKEADAQRKAMFANGWHESLEEDHSDDIQIWWEVNKQRDNKKIAALKNSYTGPGQYTSIYCDYWTGKKIKSYDYFDSKEDFDALIDTWTTGRKAGGQYNLTKIIKTASADESLEEAFENKLEDYAKQIQTATNYFPIMQENGIFEIYNLPENTVNLTLMQINNLDFVEWVQKAVTNFNVSADTLMGMPSRKYKIYGQVEI